MLRDNPAIMAGFRWHLNNNVFYFCEMVSTMNSETYNEPFKKNYHTHNKELQHSLVKHVIQFEKKIKSFHLSNYIEDVISYYLSINMINCISYRSRKVRSRCNVLFIVILHIALNLIYVI